MAWFLPAWKALAEGERFVLAELYLNNEGDRGDSVNCIYERLHIERSSAYETDIWT
jgi:hypothetical protein